MADNGFRCIGYRYIRYRYRSGGGRHRLLKLVTTYRGCSARPVTGSIYLTFKRCTSRFRISSTGGCTNVNISTIMGKVGCCTNGRGLVGRINISFGRADAVNATVCLYASGRFLNGVIFTSIVGASDGRTVSRLNRVKIGGAIVLANSGRPVTTSVTGGTNVGRCCTGLLPRRGIRGIGTLRRNASSVILCANSKVGSTPILTRSSINITVNNVNSSITVRTTSIIVVDSDLSGLPITEGVTGGAVGVIRRGVVFDVTIGILVVVNYTVNVFGRGTV